MKKNFLKKISVLIVCISQAFSSCTKKKKSKLLKEEKLKSEILNENEKKTNEYSTKTENEEHIEKTENEEQIEKTENEEQIEKTENEEQIEKTENEEQIEKTENEEQIEKTENEVQREEDSKRKKKKTKYKKEGSIKEKEEEDQSIEEENALKYTIDYESESMTFDIDKFIAKMMGMAKVEYGPNKIEAHKISINWKSNILKAEGKKGDDGKIIMEDKFLLLINNQEYYAEYLKLSFNSHRALIKGIFFTNKDNLFIRSSKLKKEYDDIFYSDKISITTCNREVPHYAITLKKARISNQDKIVSESVQLDFLGNRTLSMFLLFFQIPNKKRGIIPPSYGGSSEKGLHIKKFGYYWNFNDIIDLSVTADAYSSGSLGLNIESFYKKKYEYEGNFSYEFLIRISDSFERNTWKIIWKHNSTQNAKVNLYADVDLESKNYSKNILKKDVSTSNRRSVIRYFNSLEGIPFYSLGAEVSLNENLSSKKNKIVLPKIIFITRDLYPLKFRKNKNSWYTDLNIRHSVELKNLITYYREGIDMWKWKNFSTLVGLSRYGTQNKLPISINIPIWYLNLIPYFEYSEIWYWQFIDSDKSIKKKFSRIWSYETGVELNTNIYGTFNFSKNKNIETIRHTFSPSLKLVYKPKKKDLFSNEEDHDPFKDFPFKGPEKKESLKLHTSLNNILEIKLKNLDQKTGKNIKIPMLDQLEAKWDYDFLNKKFPWGDIEFNARTRVIKKQIQIEAKQIYDPYAYDKDEEFFVRRKCLAILRNKKLGHLKEGRLSISTNIESNSDSQNPIAQLLKQLQKKQNKENPDEASKIYMPFSIPWSLELKYSYIYKSPVPNIIYKYKVASFKLSFDLSEFWKLGLESGYDFHNEKVIKKITKINIYRDLHCWYMKFSCSPIARKQSFDFTIGVKSNILNSLKHERDNVSYENI